MPVTPTVRFLPRLARLIPACGVGFAVLAALLVVALMCPPAAFAQGGFATFSATASADAFRLLGSDPGQIPLGAQVVVAAPSAQAALASGGQSTGFASTPYPGDLVLGAPGLVASQAPLPVPGYPLYVTSNYPNTPSAATSAPGYGLHCTSSESSSTSTASVGSEQPTKAVGLAKSVAVVAVKPGSPTVTAFATSEVDEIDIKGVLQIGRLVSTARASATPTGIQRSSGLHIDGITVANQAVSWTPQGLVVGPTSTPIGMTPLGAALAQAGIAVQNLVSIKDSDGVVAEGLEVSVTEATPAAGTPSVTYVLGRASAYASGSGVDTANPDANPAISGSNTSNGSASPQPSLQAGATIPGTATSLPPVPAASAGSGQGSTTSTSPVSPVTSGLTVSPAVDTSPSRYAGTAIGIRVPSLPSTSTIYLALIAAAIVALGAGQLLRLLGVRS